jgi:AcrR family transcriptional regulator
MPVRKPGRRIALVEAAFQAIAADGFEGLRTRDVAADAGVNIATLHYYFPTKEALIAGVVEYVMGRFRSTLTGTSSPDHLRSHLHAVRSLLRSEPEIGLVMGELALRSSRDPALAKVIADANAVWHRTLRGLLRKEAREGRLNQDVDPDDVASLVMATLTSMTLPTVASGRRIDQALRQLERLLGLDSQKPGAQRNKSSN